MNRTRLAIVVAALVAVAAVAVWISRNTYWAEIDVPLPLRAEALTNPFYATQHFVRALGSPASWDRTFVAPPARAVLVMSGWHWGLSADRRHSVETWVEAGGRLVVDRTVIDDPAFQKWSGISLVTKKESASTVPARFGSSCHPLVMTAASGPASGTLPQAFVTCGVQGNSYLESENDTTLTFSDDGGVQMIRIAAGKGTVTAVNATPFIERELFDGDHAALFVAAADLRTGDEVRFLSETEVPSLLALLWQRGSPVVVLLIAWVGLWLWRIGTRFGPPVVGVAATRRSLEEQIVATGDFARRYGAGEPLVAATQRALQETASRRFPGYTRLSREGQVDLLARATGIPTDSLTRAMSDSEARGYRVLDPVHILETARRQLLTRHSRA